MTGVLFAFTGIVAFFLGSIPFGVIISKYLFHVDIRSVGSGNIGTTNAIRATGMKGGVIVFLLDFGKGLLSGLVALAVLWFLVPGGGLDPSSVLGYEEFLAFSFLCCTAGHIFSPWLNFKGGKGIAVAIGCQFVVYGPVLSLLELSIFAVLVILTRYVSVGSIAAALACVPISFIAFSGHPLALAFGVATGLLVTWAHRGNIGRLLNGTESRIGSRKSTDAPTDGSADGEE